MGFYNKILFPIIKRLDAEAAHCLAIDGLRHGLFPKPSIKNYSNLRTNVFDLDFESPIGLAAGFDKNGEVLNELFKFGFGFVEAGTVTPRPQEGNPRPRIFRLPESNAVINRLGFNNRGINEFISNVAIQRKNKIVGINIGQNKDTSDPIFDYVNLLQTVYPLSSYITINISSPNTPGLRDIQTREIFQGFLQAISQRRTELVEEFKYTKPVLVKIAPDLSDEEIADIVELAMQYKIDGLIVSNTTVSRPLGLRGSYAHETGGLSGKPLFEMSNEVLAKVYKQSNGKLPLIGVGGVSSGKDAYEKIKNGASLVQFYTAIVYQGFWVAEKIKRELSELLDKDGFKNVCEAVGINHR